MYLNFAKIIIPIVRPADKDFIGHNNNILYKKNSFTVFVRCALLLLLFLLLLLLSLLLLFLLKEIRHL